MQWHEIAEKIALTSSVPESLVHYTDPKVLQNPGNMTASIKNHKLFKGATFLRHNDVRQSQEEETKRGGTTTQRKYAVH